MPFITQGKANLKYILIVIVLAVIVGGGILGYQYWWVPQKDAKTPGIKSPVKTEDETKVLDEILDRVKNIDSIKYQRITFQNGEILQKINIWRKGKGEKIKVKNELLSTNGEKALINIYIFDTEKYLYYQYFPEENIAGEHYLTDTDIENVKNYIFGTEFAFLKDSEDLKAQNPSIIGKETIDGKECLVIQYSQVKHWIWIDYGLSIKTEGGKLEVTRKDMEVNIDIPDDIFQLPAGTKIIPGYF